MATIPPVSAIRKRLAQWLTERPVHNASQTMTPEQYEVSGWLTQGHVTSLSKLIRARIEGRGQMPVPSNPHDAVIRLSADAEARMIMSELTYIAGHPAIMSTPGIEESEDGD